MSRRENPLNRSHLLPALPLIAAGMALLALGPGCGTACDGVGCADEYGATMVGVHLSGQLTQSGTVSPRRMDASIVGDRTAGVDWSVATMDQQLWIGMPELAEVRSFSLTNGDTLTHEDSDAILRSDTGADRFGTQILPLGDLDDDGILDVAVTAPGRLKPPNDRDVGAVFLVPITALQSGDRTTEMDGARMIWGPQPGGRMGESLAACPDMDGDGHPELLIGVPWYDRSAQVPLTGAAVLVLSGDLPEANSPAFDTNDAEIWTGPSAGARAGTSVGCADLIGDSTPDLIIGAPFADGEHEGEGAIYIIDGARRLTGELDLVSQRTLNGTTENDWLGWSLATGDLDGDGNVELVAGAPGHLISTDQEASRPHGLTLIWDGQDLPNRSRDVPRARIPGEDAGDSLGRTVSIADVNADGIGDLLVGAPRRLVDDSYDAGALYVFIGSAGHASLRPESRPDTADTRWETNQPYFQTGGTLAVGDVDGDRVTDLILVHRHQPG